MRKVIFIVVSIAYITLSFVQCSTDTSKRELNSEESVDSVSIVHMPAMDSTSGLVIDEGMELVKANCTACHSSKLIIQNRASREGWLDMIRWMQETQNLWPLGANEEIILKYLAKNYAPENVGRRAPLEEIEWYTLEDK